MKRHSPIGAVSGRVVCDGSIDRKLEANLHEKNDASELVLDGHLLGESPAEVNLVELLEIAKKEFDGRTARCIDEVKLEKGWPILRAALSKAFVLWIKEASPVFLPPSNAPIPSRYHDLPLWQQWLLL